MTADQTRLEHFVTAWKASVDDVLALLRSLDADDWRRPTDLPGWDVHAVACHLAHLEAELAGEPQPVVDVPELDHVTSPMGRYTEQGPLSRQEHRPAAVIEELERAAARRHAQLEADPPRDGEATPPITPGGIGWNWQTLLSNRALDVWMHGQDIRRATGRPGDLDGLGAAHTMQVFAMSFPYSVGKRVAPPAGTTVALEVSGAQPVHLVVRVREDGRAVPLTTRPDEPVDVRLRMGPEAFIVLGGGRREPAQVPVDLDGDPVLGRRILAAMAVTP
ncbi:MAG TPA: maleylpyruvate isomerase family mycothiol-dependent enzyme [Nocardioidaceae bacterium]|nr:maleylpyruvate isomerase family mycothiol-dependent enzyme [Nocardioidaceae bacterium]